jgi:hypothetical protein
LFVLGALLSPGRAAAGCLGESLQQDLDRAEVVFVGRVTDTSHGGETVKVRVEQVWKGGPVSERETLHAIFNPRPSFETGTRYLFAPHRRSGRLVVDHCSAAPKYSGEVATLAPATVTLPRRSSTGSSGVAKQAAIALGLVAAAVTVTAVAGRRRRRARRPVSPS